MKIILSLILILSSLLYIQNAEIRSLKAQAYLSNQQMEYRTNYLYAEVGILQDVVSDHTVRIVNLESKKPRLPQWTPDLKPGSG